MNHSAVTDAVSAPAVVPQPASACPRKIKIGAVARHFEVSVDLLRLYEREGLLIPLKSPKGTRYFTELDYPWIATVLRLVREARLNFAGIRHLLALLPCWEIRGCGDGPKRDCLLAAGADAPCWKDQSCCSPAECYACAVYRAACKCENLKSFIVNGPALEGASSPAS
jgi:MerR family transcriptional regulator/heat shock protein HspR